MKKGFTLVELLTVIAIIAVISLLVLPNVISLYNRGAKNAMITQENEVVDAKGITVVGMHYQRGVWRAYHDIPLPSESRHNTHRSHDDHGKNCFFHKLLLLVVILIS